MSAERLRILNIGHDRGLLSDQMSEVQRRQLYYCDSLPAKIVHLVRAPVDSAPTPIELSPDLVIYPCPVSHWVKYFFGAASLGKRLLATESFDFIQVQEPYLTGLIGAYLSQISGVPLITGVFSDEIDNPVWLNERWLNRAANIVGKYILRRSSGIRADSRAVVNRVARIGCRNLVYIPFLITDAERLLVTSDHSNLIRTELLASLSGPLLLAVNRLESEKNVPLMLRALAAASVHLPEFVLAIAGSGRRESELRIEAEKLLPGRVRWLGWVSSEDIAAYYQAADLMLISSDRESAARVLFESMLAGTPVISTCTAGANEVIEDGVTGRIVPVGDEHAFAQAVVDLLSNPGQLKDMGLRAREQARRMVTAEAIIDQLRAFYKKVLVSV